MKLMISEVLRKAHNAKTKAQKIKILQDNNTQTLRSIFIMNYDESLVSRIPPGDVPYTPNDAPTPEAQSKLASEYRTLYNFIVGGNYDINNTRREVLFIQLLEALHADEAEVLCLVKDKKLAKKYKISFPVVKEAYPDIKWGNRV